MSTQFTLPMSTLSQMIGVVSHAAMTDEMLPALRCLKFTIGAGPEHVAHLDNRTFAKVPVTVPSLTLAATDRYRMMWATAPCKMPDEVVAGKPVEFTVTATALRALAASFPKVGRGRKAVNPNVTIEQVEGARGLTVVRFTVTTPESEQVTTLAMGPADFPDFNKVVKYGHEEPTPDLFAVNPTYAAQMFAAFNKVRFPRGPVAVSAVGANKPVRFAMDPTDAMMASGLLMVIKQEASAT